MPVYYGYVDYADDGRPFYVGKGKMLRVQLMSRRNSKHGGIAKKYGLNRRIEFASSVESIVLAWEVETIAVLGTLVDIPGIGCNFTTGGETSRPTLATRAKMSESRRKRVMPPVSEETKQKIAAANRGRKRPRELVERIADKRRGYKMTDEQRLRKVAQLKGLNVGRSLSPERRAQISAALKGRRVPPEVLAKRGPRGPHSKAWCEAISRAHRARAATAPLRTHCRAGHMLDEGRDPKKGCLVCRNEQYHARQAKKRSSNEGSGKGSLF